MEPVVLLFGLPPMEAMMVKNTLSRLGISTVIPETSQYLRPIGSFAGLKTPMIPNLPFTGSLSEPVVVLCYLPEEQRDNALDTLRQAGLCLGALKAILTPVNQYWNVVMLLEELKREHASMGR
jgi:hypothetical protein